MHRILATVFATGLLLATSARAEEAEQERPHAILLQSTSGVIGGLLVSGYGVLLAQKLNFRRDTEFALAALPFAFGAGLSVWLTGRWSGIQSNIFGAILGAGLPAALLTLAASFAEGRDAWPLTFFVAPIFSIVGAVLGFEAARDFAGSGGDMPIRRAVTDERSL